MQKEVKKLITIKELSRISGIKPDILARYVRRRLVPYEKESKDLTRYYNKNKALKCLKEIKRLEGEGLNTSEIRKYLSSKGYGPEVIVRIKNLSGKKDKIIKLKV